MRRPQRVLDAALVDDIALVGLHDHQHDHRRQRRPHGRRVGAVSAAHVLGVGGAAAAASVSAVFEEAIAVVERRGERRHAAEGGALGLLAGEPGARQRVAVAPRRR